MPEGPSIMILKQEASRFTKKKVLKATGSIKDAVKRCNGEKVIAFKTWGKHLLICFNDFTIRIHLTMFGDYLVNETKDRIPKLALTFTNGSLNFYACLVKIIEEPLNEVYDWTEDIMSPKWDPKAAAKKLKAKPDELVCDVLLDQHIFSGSGNIIKNEALFRSRIHPMSTIGAIPTRKLNQLIKETSAYSFEFLKWKKKEKLEEHWDVYTKKVCPRCDIPILKEYLGKTQRRTYFCVSCQALY